MIVCLCHGVSDREVRKCVRAGARDVPTIGKMCAAGTGCGMCKNALGNVLARERERIEERAAADGQLLLTGLRVTAS